MDSTTLAQYHAFQLYLYLFTFVNSTAQLLSRNPPNAAIAPLRRMTSGLELLLEAPLSPPLLSFPFQLLTTQHLKQNVRTDLHLRASKFQLQGRRRTYPSNHLSPRTRHRNRGLNNSNHRTPEHLSNIHSPVILSHLRHIAKCTTRRCSKPTNGDSSSGRTNSQPNRNTYNQPPNHL